MANTPPHGSQRRTAVRVDVDRIAVEIWTPRLMVWDSFPGIMLNLSAGGALVEHSRPLQLQLDVQVRFRLPQQEELFSIATTVVRVENSGPQQYQMGLQFSFSQEARRDKLTRWVFSELARRHRNWVEKLEEDRRKRGRLARPY